MMIQRLAKLLTRATGGDDLWSSAPLKPGNRPMLRIAGLNIKEATRLTREGRLNEAMDMLRGAVPSDVPPTKSRASSRARLASTLSALEVGAAFQAPGRGRAVPEVPERATFEERSYTNSSGTRQYKVYVPSSYRGDPLPLIVMLHGCTQDPDDFAVGTRMNHLAEKHGFLVAYPAQSQSANMSRCWNWFNAGEQQRSGREPSLLAGITREILRDYAVDPARVYIAGLSAGGAAASVMGATHPDLYAAVAVHSGLACGAARDMPSAFAAMKQGSFGRDGVSEIPTIVFHGDGDRTVHPINADNVIVHAKARSELTETMSRGATGGMSYTQTIHSDESGRTVHEQWLLHGAGHAWSGGDPTGSYADPRGPDASAEMVRFFLSHKRDG